MRRYLHVLLYQVADLAIRCFIGVIYLENNKQSNTSNRNLVKVI